MSPGISWGERIGLTVADLNQGRMARSGSKVFNISNHSWIREVKPLMGLAWVGST